ncbi:hypothetical protein CHGG_10371 [Chaetomium globosum CBS 148.51]|uniref:Uncharacterized protein n=1 Tax=Chaetomium globosum (strain ATCC 6205 / CBS 148.51 / DSM 1962 / NBRC 6347 / NRRL 1970) TaxID=306901 RepID=Q2GNT3_CHAGB|nr:uncharacterized protein CHGG_10371 [Chaetomium globosum CBS 148.51]EAQ83967.1 hypothetical protein CHGG_10371 [Chaetomium globosum CBS 148.51]
MASSPASTSFRTRLQQQQQQQQQQQLNPHHHPTKHTSLPPLQIQTHNIPPLEDTPTTSASPWPTHHRHSASLTTSAMTLSAGAVSPSSDRLRLRHAQHRQSLLGQHPASAHPSSASASAGGSGGGHAYSYSAGSAVGGGGGGGGGARPPLSPRGEGNGRGEGEGSRMDGAVRTVAGVMRVEKPSLRLVDSGGSGEGGDWEDEDAAGFEWGYRSRGVDGHRARGGGFATAGRGGGGVGTSSSRYALRRPRSTAGWVRSSAASIAAPTTSSGANGQPQQRTGVVKKTSFLAPLWDGVREKLNLSKSKSSGSIGRVVNSVVGGGGADKKIDREKEKARLMGIEEKEKVASPPPPPGPAYPSREEVMESYKNLVASGFFEAHAIRGGRHPLRSGGAAGKAFAEHMVIPETSPAPSRKSFSEHMAEAEAAASSPARSFADHMAAQQPPAPPLSSPIRKSMAPPAPPPRGSSQKKSDLLSSPQRGTKRGASMDLATDAEVVTRKLVKKLRHSASRLSVELTGVRDNYYSNYGTLKARPSTSCGAPGPLSPTSSVFSGITSPPSTRASMDGIRSPRYGKLTKPKDGRRRRILGLSRRNRSPVRASAPVTSAPAAADPDAMVIDEPEQATATQAQPAAVAAIATMASPKPHRNITPPPASFRTNHPRSLRSSDTSSSAVSPQHEPLSVVPDPNQGIPFVPRIPREFCDAMTALVPPAAAAAAAARGAVVVVAGEGKEKKGEETGEDGKGKPINRDSGLGEDVENIPDWG